MIPARCPKCRIRMYRVGLEESGEHGVVVTFECPNCHSRTERAVSHGGIPLPKL